MKIPRGKKSESEKGKTKNEKLKREM